MVRQRLNVSEVHAVSFAKTAKYDFDFTASMIIYLN
jgi:hypothetical protein